MVEYRYILSWKKIGNDVITNINCVSSQREGMMG